MGAADIVLLALVALWSVAAAVFAVRRRKRGCCGDCAACGGECDRK